MGLPRWVQAHRHLAEELELPEQLHRVQEKAQDWLRERGLRQGGTDWREPEQLVQREERRAERAWVEPLAQEPMDRHRREELEQDRERLAEPWAVHPQVPALPPAVDLPASQFPARREMASLRESEQMAKVPQRHPLRELWSKGRRAQFREHHQDSKGVREQKARPPESREEADP